MMTNVQEIAREVQKFRQKHSRRTIDILNGMDSHEKEVFRATIKGMVKGMGRQGRISPGEEGVVMAVEECNWEEVYDNLSGAALDKDMVKEARKEEMAEVHKHGVYVKVNIEECYEKTGKAPIGTRWVDVNKGDSVHPEYRSRLVAQEINTGKREDLFAATPP